MVKEPINNIISGIKNSLKGEKHDRWYDYMFAIVINIIFLYIVNNLLYWNLSFIANTFSEVLWALNLTLVVTIVVNVIFILYDPSWFKHSAKIITSFTALVAAFTVLTVFPFVLSQLLAIGLTILFILAIIASIVSIIIEIIKLINLIAVS